MVTRSSHSMSMCPPHSPTRITKYSILKLAGAFHCPKTSRIRFWAFSYSMGEPCGRSNQLITYFTGVLLSSVKIARATTAWAVGQETLPARHLPFLIPRRQCKRLLLHGSLSSTAAVHCTQHRSSQITCAELP